MNRIKCQAWTNATRAKKLWWLNVTMLIIAIVLWIAAFVFGWLSSLEFVSHVSMLALVYSAISGVAAGDAAVEAENGTKS